MISSIMPVSIIGRPMAITRVPASRTLRVESGERVPARVITQATPTARVPMRQVHTRVGLRRYGGRSGSHSEMPTNSSAGSRADTTSGCCRPE